MSFVYRGAPNCPQHWRLPQSRTLPPWPGWRCWADAPGHDWPSWVSGHGWLRASLALTPAPFPELPSTLLLPSPYTQPGLPCPRCRIQHLPLLHFIGLVIALCQCLCRASVLERVDSSSQFSVSGKPKPKCRKKL